MNKTIKLLIKNIFKILGYKIEKFNLDINKIKLNDKKISSQNNQFTFLHGIITTVFVQKARGNRKFAIVQIGANDGITIDPVYPFAINKKNSTSLLLIEPQIDLLYSLRKSYASHPSVKIANLAIGKSSRMTLYRIRPDLQRYYMGIIGSGITSEDKSYVERKAYSLLPTKIINKEKKQGNSLIDSFEVDSMRLVEVLKRYNFSNKVDWLQVDTEGFDDIVIYNSDISILTPAVISYEISHFSNERHFKLNSYLDNFGYIRFQTSNEDECAIASDIVRKLENNGY